jgi:hypothetical protein
MHQLQLIYDRQAGNRQKMKELKVMIADALEKDPKYQSALMDLNDAKAKVNAVKTSILERFQGDIDNIEILKTDVLSDRELMTIEALTLFRHDKDVIVKDKKGIEYVAEFSVRFKKK